MIDYFAIALTHGLILLACWRLLSRDDLDSDGALVEKPRRAWERPAPGPEESDASDA